MKDLKQVSKSHYDFKRYMSIERWISLWHQLDEVLNRDPATILEVGPGNGLFKVISATYGHKVATVDIDPDLNPDYVCSATSLPFDDRSFDIVCSFQMLEHLPYETALQAFKEMARVARCFIIISIPDARPVWFIRGRIPKLRPFSFIIQKPFFKPKPHKITGEHYWEVGKSGYDLKKIINDLNEHAHLIESYRVVGNFWHRFFVFEKRANDKT